MAPESDPAVGKDHAIRLRSGLLLAFAYVLLLAVVALGVPLALNLRDRVDAEVRSEARGQADIVAATAAEFISPPQRSALADLAQRAAVETRGRTIIVDARGVVLADNTNAATGQSYAARPEIAVALRGGADQRVRHSDTLGVDLLATAVPVVRQSRPAGAVRITQDYRAVGRSVRRTLAELAVLGVVVLVLGLAAGAAIAAAIVRPLRRLEATARDVAGGDLDARATVEGSEEQRSLARSFNEMTRRLGTLVRSREQFVADAAHALRTPLTGLRLRLEEATAADPPPDVKAEVDAATSEVDRLAAVVEELLELSRAGEPELPPERVDLGEAARRAGGRWAATARERGLALEVVADGAGDVRAAATDVDRALDPLVENALAYSPRGTTVRIAATPGRIEVLDEGPGFAPGEEEAVLERFHRGQAGAAVPGGSGLGLAIARELASRWSAELELANRDGRGAVARLRWP